MPINQAGHAFRRMRRFLQGRGVEYRRFTGTSGAGSVTVAGLKSQDELVSVIRYPVTAGNLTDAIELLTETQVPAVQASATPVQAGVNNDITWNAQSPSYEGTKGNALSVEMLADTVLAVDVIAGTGGQETKVSIKINNTVTTANQVIDAVAAHPQAASMIFGEASEGTGDGVSVAVAATSLAGGVDAYPAAAVKTVTAPVQAFLTTALAGANNDITWNAQLPLFPGTKGNSLSIEYLNNGASKPLTVDVIAGAGGQETKVSVQLATDSGSVITSTANDVLDAVAAHPQARDLMYGENAGADTGAGLVIALAATSLAGGLDESVAVTHAALLATDKVMIDWLSQA